MLIIYKLYNYLFVEILRVAIVYLMRRARDFWGFHDWFNISGWFGIRKDFCHFLLSLCPFLQEYANIAYTAQDTTSTNDTSEAALQEKAEKSLKKCDFGKTVVPIVSIETPDWYRRFHVGTRRKGWKGMKETKIILRTKNKNIFYM